MIEKQVVQNVMMQFITLEHSYIAITVKWLLILKLVRKERARRQEQF